MKKSYFITASILLAGVLSLTAPDTANAVWGRQTITLPFGERNILIDAPNGMCFMDKSNPKQASFINTLRDQSWKGRKNVVMTLLADCREILGLENSKDPVPLSRMLILRWLNPDIGENSDMIPNDYLDMREVSLRAYTLKNLTQFHSVKVEDAPKRMDNAVGIGYVGTSMIDGAPFITVGVDATTLVQDIPVEITYMKTNSSIDKPDQKTEPLFKFVSKFIDQQLTINAK